MREYPDFYNILKDKKPIFICLFLKGNLSLQIIKMHD